MKNTTVYALKRLDKNHIQPMKANDIIDLLDEAINVYTNAVGVIRANEPTQEFIPHYAFARIKIQKFGSVIVHDGPNDSHIAKLSLEELTFFLEEDRKVKAKLEAGELVKGESIFYTEHRGQAFMIHGCTITPAVICDKCEEALIEEILADHQALTSCKDAELEARMSKTGLYGVEEGDDEAELAKTKNIPIEYHPSGYRMYVPKWVEGAITAFKKNSHGTYAGMELHEYLDKLVGPK